MAILTNEDGIKRCASFMQDACVLSRYM